MRIYSNQSMYEFLQDVRDQAVKAGAKWPLIDKIDELMELGSLDTQEYALEVARTQGAEDAEKRCQETIDELRDTIERLEARIESLELEG